MGLGIWFMNKIIMLRNKRICKIILHEFKFPSFQPHFQNKAHTQGWKLAKTTAYMTTLSEFTSHCRLLCLDFHSKLMIKKISQVTTYFG